MKKNGTYATFWKNLIFSPFFFFFFSFSFWWQSQPHVEQSNKEERDCEKKPAETCQNRQHPFQIGIRFLISANLMIESTINSSVSTFFDRIVLIFFFSFFCQVDRVEFRGLNSDLTSRWRELQRLSVKNARPLLLFLFHPSWNPCRNILFTWNRRYSRRCYSILIAKLYRDELEEWQIIRLK